MNNPFESIEARLANIETLLLDIKHKPINGPPRSDPEEFLTVQEAAIFLKLSVPTVYAMIHQKRIPFMRSLRRCYFLKADLISYLKQGREKSNAELSEEVNKYEANKRELQNGK